MSEWRRAVLEDLAHFQRGFDISKAEQQSGDVPVVSSSGITSYHSVAKVKGPGVTIGRKGTLGTVFYIQRDYWPHSTSLWVTDFKGNAPRYVYYFLKTLGLEKFDVGASNPTLNRNHIHGLPISIPPLSTQRRIAEILSAYDDLIENNLRRIEILEKTILLAYRRMMLREDPQWKRCRIGDVCDCVLGGTPNRKKAEFWGGDVPWINSGKINELRIVEPSEYITKLGLDCSAAKLMPKHTTVLAITGATLGQVSLLELDCSANQSVIGVLENPQLPYSFIYPMILNGIETLAALRVGGAQQHINKDNVEGFEFVMPDEDSLASYHNSVDPMFRQMGILLRQNISLAAARDMLLPQLMSGKLEVA